MMEGPSRIEDRVSAVWRDGDPVLWWNGEWMTARKLFDMAEDSKMVLSGGGFRRGDRLMVLMPNCPALLALSIAGWRLGGTVVPVNPQAGPEAVLSSIDAVEPCAVVVGAPLEGAFSSLSESPVPSSPCLWTLPSMCFEEPTPRSRRTISLCFSLHPERPDARRSFLSLMKTF